MRIRIIYRYFISTEFIGTMYELGNDISVEKIDIMTVTLEIIIFNTNNYVMSIIEKKYSQILLKHDEFFYIVTVRNYFFKQLR